MKRPGTVPLARAISKLGLASRAEAVALIRDGRVTVNGRVADSPRQLVVPERIALAIDGKAGKPPGRLTVLLNKPRGVVTSRRDPEGRATVLDLVRDAPVRVLPVGRLDMASTGLLVLTNDHRLAAWVTDPANHVRRSYVVTVRGFLDDRTCARLQEGLDIGGEHLKPDSIRIRKRSRRETHLLVDLVEGRNREIRRLFASADHEVTRLVRVAFGGLRLGDLPPGRWRVLTDDELAAAFPGVPPRRHDL